MVCQSSFPEFYEYMTQIANTLQRNILDDSIVEDLSMHHLIPMTEYSVGRVK